MRFPPQWTPTAAPSQYSACPCRSGPNAAAVITNLLKLSSALWLGLTFSVPALAEMSLTWEACIQEAAIQNPDLRAAHATLQAARYRAEAAGSGNLPQLSAGAGYTDSSGSATPSSNTASHSTSVTLTQNLFSGFQDKAKVEQGAANREVAEAGLSAAKARLSQELKAAYSGLRYSQDNVTLTQNIGRRLEENLRLVELRFEGGRENKGSYLLTKAALAQARYESLQASQALVTAQAQLARVLGRREAGELQVHGPIPLAEPPPPPDYSRLVAQVPDYRQSVAQEKSAVAEVTQARSGYYPSLNLTGSVAREGSDGYPDDSRRSVGLNLAIPLYSGGRDYYGVKGAASSLEAAAAAKDNLERQLLVRLRQVYAGYIESVEKLKVDQAFLEAATTRAEIARSRYNNGLISFEDWDRIESDLIARQKAFLLSQRDRILAEASWEQAQGKGVIP